LSDKNGYKKVAVFVLHSHTKFRQYEIKGENGSGRGPFDLATDFEANPPMLEFRLPTIVNPIFGYIVDIETINILNVSFPLTSSHEQSKSLVSAK
jgi:hypothetical protein